MCYILSSSFYSRGDLRFFTLLSKGDLSFIVGSSFHSKGDLRFGSSLYSRGDLRFIVQSLPSSVFVS
jgi:hypothetical protein